MTAKRTGLFSIKYSIGTGALGAPTIQAEFAVNTMSETLTGLSTLTHAVNTPLELRSHIQGDCSDMAVMPKQTHIRVKPTGTPSSQKSPHAQTAAQTEDNIELEMVLDEDWKSGTVNYKYRDGQGSVNEVENVPVKQINNI